MSRFFPKADHWISGAAFSEPFASVSRIYGAPAGLDGMVALFASDLHLRPSMDARKLAQCLIDQRADLVLLGGDLADTRRQALRLLHALRNLRAPMGVFAVPGNNDVEAFGSMDGLRAALREINAQLLVNESALCLRSGARLAVGGADEPRYGRPSPEKIFHEDADYRILLSHYPLQAMLAAKPNLMLSGHTHGGQFNLFGLTPYAVGFERFGARNFPPLLVSGEADFGPCRVMVSKGVGSSRIPLRVGVRPEIHRVEFFSAAK